MQIAINPEVPSHVDIVLGLTHVVRVPLDDRPVTYHRVTEMGLLEVEKWDAIDDGVDVMTGTTIIEVGSLFSIGIAEEGFDIMTLDGDQITGGLWEEQDAWDLIV